MLEKLKKQIPIISNCRDIIEIKKGYSLDEKYLIQMNDDHKFLLRLFDIKQFELKKQEFTILEKMMDFNVSCSQPISIGELENRGYIITSFIEGNDAEEQLPNFSEEEQFNIGIEAGKELRKIHQYPAPNHISSWYSRKVKKHKNYIDAYLACDVKVMHDKKIMDFIEENSHLMKQRPNLFQHDDFTLGNIIVKDKKFAGVIDFNRFDWGDPIHEFLKIGIFSRQVSVPFSVGQIKGYFNNTDPDGYFWRLYSLYLAMCVFSSVVWTLKYFPDNINDMMDKIDRFLEDHDYFRNLKPAWYV